MRGHLWPLGKDEKTVTRIAIHSSVGVFRSDAEYTVYAETDDQIVDLGVADVTVSRKHNGTPPVELIPTSEGITVTNHANKNDVIVDHSYSEQSVEQGERELITEDCTLKIGYNTHLRLNVEPDRERSQTLSAEELEEALDGTSGRVVEGVPPARFAQSLTDNLRKAQTESANECLKFLTELADFVDQQAVETDNYDDVRKQVKEVQEQLQRHVESDALRGDFTTDDTWQERIDRIAHRVERLYATE